MIKKKDNIPNIVKCKTWQFKICKMPCRADNLINCTVMSKNKNLLNHCIQYLGQCGRLGYWTSAGGSWPWQIHHKGHGQVQITGEQQHKPVTRQKFLWTISTKNSHSHRFFIHLSKRSIQNPRITYDKQ